MRYEVAQYTNCPMGRALRKEERDRGREMTESERARFLYSIFKEIRNTDEAFLIVRAVTIVEVCK